MENNETMNETKMIDETKASTLLESNYATATTLLNNVDEIERFLQRLEEKMKIVPVVGEKLAMVPVLASLIKNFVSKEYTDIPIGTIIAIIAALLYFVSPIDLVPDSIPVLGYFDDAAVVTVCWKMVESDVKEYQVWREKNNKLI